MKIISAKEARETTNTKSLELLFYDINNKIETRSIEGSFKIDYTINIYKEHVVVNGLKKSVPSFEFLVVNDEGSSKRLYLNEEQIKKLTETLESLGYATVITNIDNYKNYLVISW